MRSICQEAASPPCLSFLNITEEVRCDAGNRDSKLDLLLLYTMPSLASANISTGKDKWFLPK